ncbi:UNVERIFIED_CONTAM: Retrovirus-related Pol polyprotein from transposon TNT 1-94 [Sesamum calycinum]|uniref:Retrovirus-related Pol polyprotein from transposon TNT 1-94 n=1 Tax=Sesamum calycinum TaxID=2727403 RepID=A0AAW2MAU7_9LAMI
MMEAHGGGHGLTHGDPWRRGPKDKVHDGDGGNKEIMSKNPLTVILDNNKFNGTNYTDWLHNLRIVLDYENQGYIMDKLLPQTLPDGSSSEERETFERWLDDVASILQRLKGVYAIPDRHTRYVATKEFFRAKMTEGSSVQEHGVKMLSLVENLEDLKAGLENDTYINVILQSLPPSYDPFIVNFNMNGLEKSINEFINMLAKGKRVGRWKKQKGKAKAKTVVVAKDAKSAPVAPVGMDKGKKRMGIFVIEINMVTNSASWVLDTGCGAHICNDLQVPQRSRKLSKDEVVLRLGDGKAVAAEAVGIINLVVSDPVRLELKDSYFIPSMIKNIISILLLDNAGFEFLINKNCFYLMKDGSSHLLGKLNNGLYILQRMKRLVDSKNLKIDNFDNLPACKSCLKGKMTRKPFVGHSKLANGLLDLIHTDVCGPLNTQARGGFSYFIIFTDDHSRYGYVYLMSYKSEAFVRFKELRLEGYALETAARLLNIAPSMTVAQTLYQIWHGKPASYKYLRVWGSPAYIKRLVGDKLDSRSSLCRFIGYSKETAGYYFYDPSEQKVFVSRNAVFFERGCPTDTRRDELLLEESSEAPQSNAGTSSAPTVSTDNVNILRRSARVPKRPVRYGFLGVTGQLDNDHKLYGEVISDID